MVHVQVLDNMTRVCELNKLNCNVIYGLQLSSSLLSLCWPSLVPLRSRYFSLFILTMSKDASDLFATIAFMLQSSPDAVFLSQQEVHNSFILVILTYLQKISMADFMLNFILQWESSNRVPVGEMGPKMR